MTNNSSSNEASNSGIDSSDVNLQPKIVDCPTSINAPVLQDESQWIPYVESHGTIGYVGNFLFHGNQETFLENKEAFIENPQAECTFLVTSGELIDKDHQYSGMGGSANYYSDSFNHTFTDPGGIAERGWEGFTTSMEYYFDSTSESLTESASESADFLEDYSDSVAESIADEANALYEDSWLESAIDYYDSYELEAGSKPEQSTEETDASSDLESDAVDANYDEEASLFFDELSDLSELDRVAYSEETTDFIDTPSPELAATENVFSSPEYETVSFDTASFESYSPSYESDYGESSSSSSEAAYAGEL